MDNVSDTTDTNRLFSHLVENMCSRTVSWCLFQVRGSLLHGLKEVAILRHGSCGSNFSFELNKFSEPRDGTGDSSYSSGLRVTYYVTQTFSMGLESYRRGLTQRKLLGMSVFTWSYWAWWWKYERPDGRMNVNRPITGQTDKPLGWL